MTLVKTCFLLLFSVLFITPTVSEVVQYMTDCKGFLLDNKPPQVPDILENDKILDNNRYKVICQTYENVRRFVTLYDTNNKIPVLSAYKFTEATGKRPREESWKIEPQLEDMNADKNMVTSSETKEYNNQAGDIDYTRSGYDRGHLFPSSYAKNQDDKISTFTLTNAVPQVPSFNQRSWRKMEAHVKGIMESACIDNNNVIEAYVMTGAQPNVSNTINNRVNVPSLLWSAFCCHYKKENKWIAGAYWGTNVLGGPGNLTLVTLAQLYKELSKGKKKCFKAFPKSKCPLNQIPSDSDPQMNKNNPPKRSREEF